MESSIEMPLTCPNSINGYAVLMIADYTRRQALSSPSLSTTEFNGPSIGIYGHASHLSLSSGHGCLLIKQVAGISLRPGRQRTHNERMQTRSPLILICFWEIVFSVTNRRRVTNKYNSANSLCRNYFLRFSIIFFCVSNK